MSIKDTAAIVGVGATPYYKRGQSYPESEFSMACTAILLALEDAGLTVNDLDGFSIYSSSCDPASVGAELRSRSNLRILPMKFASCLRTGSRFRAS